MELVLYFLVVALVSVSSFWLLGSLYGLVRTPAIYFPLGLATKMALAAVLGAFLLGIGGVVLATLIFNAEMMKRSDYRRWSTLLVGVGISIICTIAIYYAVMFLAWGMLD
jgi:hypothetical protein